jgi:putative ABC transport system substrate-binding protein
MAIASASWEATRAVASQLRLAAELFDVRSEADIVQAFSTMVDKRLDALSVGIDFLIQAHAARIVELAAHHRIPTAYPTREMVEIGGLLSYGVNYPGLYFRAAGLIDKIFKGASPGDLPVEQPTKLELLVNLRTAKALGLELPPTLIARADEVIE